MDAAAKLGDSVGFYKLHWDDEVSTVVAESRLPRDHVVSQVLEDPDGHLFVLHSDVTYGDRSDPSYWMKLDIFDAHTLTRHARLDIDAWTGLMRYEAGAVLIPAGGTTLQIDMRDEQNPRVVVAQVQ